MRYRGTYITRRSVERPCSAAAPIRRWYPRSRRCSVTTIRKGSYADLNNILFYYLNFTKGPARLAGGAALVHETLDRVKEPRQAWAYAAGQRRVRRAPNLAYDTPIAASEGLRTADDTDMFNGSPDRYEWKLLGKKGFTSLQQLPRLRGGGEYGDVLKIGHVNPALTRNELHRVWVVEGTLKPGARHVYGKRTCSSTGQLAAAVVDQYDTRGELWRVSIAYLKNYYDLPTTWSAMEAFHDLQSRRYYVQNLDTEEPGTVNFAKAVPGTASSPFALRRRGTR